MALVSITLQNSITHSMVPCSNSLQPQSYVSVYLGERCWTYPQVILGSNYCSMFTGRSTGSKLLIYKPRALFRRKLITPPSTKVRNHFETSPWKATFWHWHIDRLIDSKSSRQHIFFSSRNIFLKVRNISISMGSRRKFIRYR